MTPPGMIMRQSARDGSATAELLRQFVDSRQLRVFARIDHECAALEVGLELPFTQVLIFGNPLTGTPLMRHTSTLAIDLPLRALIWEDAAGSAWLGYDDPDWVAARHAMLPEAAAAFASMRQLLAAAAEAATR